MQSGTVPPSIEIYSGHTLYIINLILNFLLICNPNKTHLNIFIPKMKTPLSYIDIFYLHYSTNRNGSFILLYEK